MALDANLLGHPAPGSGSPEEPEWGLTRASALFGGERRLEAASYLSDGYGLRRAIESRPTGWRRVGSLASVWQPSRLKGIVVSPDRGVAFLSAGQVFEARPSARKYLSLQQTPDAQKRFVEMDTLLVSCSGDVGRVTIAHSPHAGKLITHDLLRVEPNEKGRTGWLYAALRTHVFRSMAVSEHYGHVIKHIEPSHLSELPLVSVPDAQAEWFQDRVTRIFRARDKAHALEASAFAEYAEALPVDTMGITADVSGIVHAADLLTRRRRLDAYYHNRVVAAIRVAVAARAERVDSLESVCERIFAPGRFSREFGPEGIPYRSAEQLFDMNAPVDKRIYAGLVEDRDEYMLHPGWIVMACSGQIYGLNGAVMLLNGLHRGVFGTHDLIRIVPNLSKVRAGYLIAALGHPELGRPLVIRHAYGTSIPHLDVIDVRTIAVPRLTPAVENRIADALEGVAVLRADADVAENEVTAKAEGIFEAFMKGRLER